MDVKKTGGPAYPVKVTWLDEGILQGSQTGIHEGYHEGMTLRDWFAGQALMGLIASNAHALTFNPDDDGAYVYAIADAMLKAREMPND